MDEIKRCKHCGGEAELRHKVYNGYEYSFIMCKSCYIKTDLCARDAVAIHRWNSTPKDRQESCEWTFDGQTDAWFGSCGIGWRFESGSNPDENGMRYCPNCGRQIASQNLNCHKSLG